jgi:hypothetical protein
MGAKSAESDEVDWNCMEKSTLNLKGKGKGQKSDWLEHANVPPRPSILDVVGDNRPKASEIEMKV